MEPHSHEVRICIEEVNKLPILVLRYLVGQEAIFLTILREPVSQFESLFTFYKLERGMPIQEYINERYDG